MGIIRINDLPEGSGSLSGDDIFLFMDDPSGGGVTKKISLSQVAAAIGGGGNAGNADTGDISFSGISIIGSGSGSGDGNGYGTIELVPDNTLYDNNQYLIVDPTAPNHIHLRAGGDQDSSNADLIIGGEYNNLVVTDSNDQVKITTTNIGIYTIGANANVQYGNIGVDGNPPVGSVFTVNGVTYTVTGAAQYDAESNGTGMIISPEPTESIEGSFTFYAPSNYWTFGNDGDLSIPGNILLDNGTSVAVGTYDNSTGGNNGISLNCYVGYELNWQGGHLKCTQNGGTTSANITLDSALQFSDNSILCSTADNLLEKYTAAKLLTPGGNPLSATNRATLIIMPGNYSVSSTLDIDTNYVDVIGLGSIKLERGAIPAVNLSGGINVTASDVRVKGISVGSDNFTIVGATNQIFEDCSGGNYSFAGGYSLDENDNIIGGVASGSFINCVGGDNSFAGHISYGGTASGTFINCVAGNYSFGSFTAASGSFTNCSGGYSSFGGWGTASGSFSNCSAGGGSFGGGDIASGTFKDCTGGSYSFGGDGNATGTFTNCSGGDFSFGSWGTASGSFKDCTGGIYSFGGYGIASGSFLRCTLTTGTFPTLSGTGKYRLCIDGNYDVINADAT